MSMENEESDPTAQFDAFRRRQAEERAQQEAQGAYGFPDLDTQAGYTFPPEYEAEPSAVYVPPMPDGPPPGSGVGGRMRSLLVVAAALLVACVLGLGAWMAFGSSSPSANAAATGATGTPGAAAAGAGPRALTFRVTVASVGSDSFTGKVLADGDSVTVAMTAKTRFGTKAHAFSLSDLSVGETVLVRGRRTGTGTITATEVAANVAATGRKSPAATATATAGDVA